MNKILIIVALAGIYLFLASCSKRQAEEIKPNEVVVPPIGTPDPAITYANFVQNLFQTKCANCHASGRSAAGIWTFNGHASILSSSAIIKQVVLVTKTMPRGGSLTPTELSSLQTWFDSGLPQ
jgi:uncharacterized membrane protein